MGLDIQQREREGITILEMHGRLTAGQEVSVFRGLVSGLVNDGRKNLILSMADVDYVDSTGLGALVMCATGARKQGGDIKLLNLNKRNIELLVITKLATIFDLFTDEQDAVNSFFPGRKVSTFDILNFVQQMKEE